MHVLDFLALGLKLFLAFQLGVGLSDGFELATQGFGTLLTLLELFLVGFLHTLDLPGILPLNTFGYVVECLVGRLVFADEVHSQLKFLQSLGKILFGLIFLRFHKLEFIGPQNAVFLVVYFGLGLELLQLRTHVFLFLQFMEQPLLLFCEIFFELGELGS